MSAQVTWQGGLTFGGTADSGFSLKLGADPSVGGDDDGFRPMELMALALAGCTAMDVISIMLKKRQEVERFEVSVQTEQAQEYPKVYTQMHLHYFVAGKEISEEALLRSIELSETKYCPAQAMLREATRISFSYTIEESG